MKNNDNTTVTISMRVTSKKKISKFIIFAGIATVAICLLLHQLGSYTIGTASNNIKYASAKLIARNYDPDAAEKLYSVYDLGMYWGFAFGVLFTWLGMTIYWRIKNHY